MSEFKGKVALVTGGTSGIGRVTAVALGREGARVVVTGRREAEGAAVVKEIGAAGGQGWFVKGDVSVEADVKRMVDETVSKFGRLDLAFNNAGIEVTGAIHEARVEDYRKCFDINVLGVLLSMKHEIPAMLKGGGGAIVNNASVAGTIGMPGAGVYIASKHAVLGLTKSAAMETAKQNIRINAVSPAAIQTDMFDRFVGGGPETDGAKYMTSLHPVGRVGRPEEIARPVLFLLSSASSFMTGHDLKVDGGLTVP